MESQHLSMVISRSVEAVYEYASNPANLPAWAGGLSVGIELVDGEWVSISPLGRVTVKMTEPNTLGSRRDSDSH